MNKQFKKISVDSVTKDRIEEISKITNISQSKLLAELIDSLAHVYCEFEKATFSCDYSPLDNTITIIVHGKKRKGCLTFGTCRSESELQAITDKQIREDLKP